jgi:hypothetical protein
LIRSFLFKKSFVKRSAMTMGVQLDVDALSGHIAHLLRSHEMKESLGYKSLKRQAQMTRQALDEDRSFSSAFI